MNYFRLREYANLKRRIGFEEHLVVWLSRCKWACWLLIKCATIFTNLTSIYTNINQKLANLILIFINLNWKFANLLSIFANLMKSEQTFFNTCKPNTLVVEIKWSLFYLFALSMSSFLIQLLYRCESLKFVFIWATWSRVRKP